MRIQIFLYSKGETCKIWHLIKTYKAWKASGKYKPLGERIAINQIHRRPEADVRTNKDIKTPIITAFHMF